MTNEQWIEIPTWPQYNQLNRVYLGGGAMPDADHTVLAQQATAGADRGEGNE